MGQNYYVTNNKNLNNGFWNYKLVEEDISNLQNTGDYVGSLVEILESNYHCILCPTIYDNIIYGIYKEYLFKFNIKTKECITFELDRDISDSRDYKILGLKNNYLYVLRPDGNKMYKINLNTY